MADILDKACGPQSLRQIQTSFADFTESELKSIFSYFEHRRYAAGAPVWQQGEPMEFMGVLLDGKLVVKREGRFAGKHIILAVLEKGALFGEMSVAAQQPHSMTLTAVEQTEVCILNHEKAQELFRKEPLVSVKFLQKIVVVSSLRLQHMGSRLAELL